jgi:hypothetical protein
MSDMVALEIFEDGAVFRHGDGYDEIVEELDEALDQRDAGVITPARYLRILTAIVERHPHFIDGHAHLGNALMGEGRPKLARFCVAPDAASRSGVISPSSAPTPT